MSDPLQLPERLDLSTALQLVSDLREIDGDVKIDAAKVTHLGALCLQALLAASRDANAKGHTFDIPGLSEKATEQLGFMGITPEQLMEGAL